MDKNIKLKRALFSGLLLLSSFYCFGQAWNIEAGYQNFRINDRNTSPLSYSANNGLLGFSFQKQNMETEWNIGASVSAGSMQSVRFGQRETTSMTDYDIYGNQDSIVYVINPALSFVNVKLSFVYTKKLNHGMQLGAMVNDVFSYGALGADVWFLNQLSINPMLDFTWLNMNKHKLHSTISTPIISYLLQQPYTLDPSLPVPSYFSMYLKTGSSLLSINKFQQINLEIIYAYLLGEKNAMGLTYRFSWMNLANYENRNLRSYSNTVSLTYTF